MTAVQTFALRWKASNPKRVILNRIREAVLDRLLADQMSMQHIQQAMRRDFFLDLSDGFLYDSAFTLFRVFGGQLAEPRAGE